MLIESLWIENFRSIRKLRIDELGAFNVFYGENGAGKSNVLAAADMLLGVLGSWAAAPAPRLPSPFRESDFRFPPHLLREITIGARLVRTRAGRRAGGRFPEWLEFEIGATEMDRPEVVVKRVVTHEGDMTTAEAFAHDDHEWWTTQLKWLSSSFRLLPAVRALGVESDTVPTPDLRGADRIAFLLGEGRLKQALVEAVTSPEIEVRAGLKRMQGIFQGPPLDRRPFDPIFDPAAHRYELNEIHEAADGEPYAVPVDLAGLGIQQIYTVMAGILLSGASMVAVEEPEAHLHPRTSGLQLRALLKRAVDDGHIDQLFIATHSNLFDLDPTGYFLVRNDPAEGTLVERHTEFAMLDRQVFWEPGPARHALQDMLRYLPADAPVFRRADGTPIGAGEMLTLLQADDPDAIAFVDDVQSTAVRTVQRIATRKA